MLCIGINRMLTSLQSSCFYTTLRNLSKMRVCPVASHLIAPTVLSYSYTWLSWSLKTQPHISVPAVKTQPYRVTASLCANLCLHPGSFVGYCELWWMFPVGLQKSQTVIPPADSTDAATLYSLHIFRVWSSFYSCVALLCQLMKRYIHLNLGLYYLFIENKTKPAISEHLD
jgi:hypothetical protein